MRQTILWIWCVIYKAATINFNFAVYNIEQMMPNGKIQTVKMKKKKNFQSNTKFIFTYRQTVCIRYICNIRNPYNGFTSSYLVTFVHTKHINNSEFKTPYRKTSVQMNYTHQNTHSSQLCFLQQTLYINML